MVRLFESVPQLIARYKKLKSKACAKCGGLLLVDEYAREIFCLSCGFRVHPQRAVKRGAR